MGNIPWIPEDKASETSLPLPINTQDVTKFLKSSQILESLYKSLEETFWVIIGLEQLGEFPETAHKALISYVMKHKIDTGGYSSKLEGNSADIWSTFYAIALLDLVGVFKGQLGDKKVFCPNCGQKQLLKSEICFNCGDSIVPELSPCAICNKVVQHTPPETILWEKLCNTCHENLVEDIDFILRNQKKKGFMHCDIDKCIICQGKPTYKSIFFALNTLSILKSLDRLDKKAIIVNLKKNQYIQDIERVFQLLSYFLLEYQEDIDYSVLLESIKLFQQVGGFALDKKIPVISNTFWCIVPFWLLKKLDMIQLGPILKFLVGLKRGDGGYSEQIMDGMSNITSTVQALFIILFIFPTLVEQLENEILRESSALNRIYLDPIAEKYLVSSDFVEGIAYELLSKEWFEGKILDQLDFFLSYLEKSNVVTQKLGKSLIEVAQKQSEINITEFSKEFDFENAEQRLKTGIIDFLSKRFLEGDIQKVKKHYLFQNMKLPRKFIFLEKNVPINAVFEEKAQITPKRQEIESKFQELVDLLLKIAEEIQSHIEQGETDQARKRLLHHDNEFPKLLDEYETKLNTIVASFKYMNFRAVMSDFLEEFPTNKKSLIAYLNKLEERLSLFIEKKEKSKAHDARLSKEQRIIENFEEYLLGFIDKVDLLMQNFKREFQQNYMDLTWANKKTADLKESIQAFDKDVSEKESQLNESIELIEKPEQVNKIFNKLTAKIEILKEIETEASNILKSKAEIPIELDKKVQEFKVNLDKSRSITIEKIDSKEFDSASKELETQDAAINQFKIDIRQSLEENIKITKDNCAHFIILFENLRELLNDKLKNLENEWNTQKEELLTKKLEKTELAQKTQLKKMMKDNIETETEQFESLKQEIDNKIRHENISEANSQIENSISKFNQKAKKFENEINEFIKNTSKKFRSFKKNVTEIIQAWKKDKDFILQSMNTLKDQITNLIREKDLMKDKNKLGLIIKNQKLLLTKSLSTLLKLYRESLEKGNVLQQETPLSDGIRNIQQELKKGDSQIYSFIKDTVKKVDQFQEVTKEQAKLWQKESNLLSNALQKLHDYIAENILIERIYFIIKAFQGYQAEIKYLAKSINMKASQLKDKLVYLISNSRLDGNLDPINDMLNLSSLKPVIETTNALLQPLEENIGQVLQIDFEKKEAIPQDIQDKKQSLLQLRYLLIIHRHVGATLFHRKFGTWEINPDLISGFLTAIQSFGQEIKSKAVPIRKMAYKEFEILLNQGDKVFVALIVDGKTSDWHEQKLADFTKAFEEEFQQTLKIWSGELTQFKSTGLMIDRVFELFRAYI